MTDSPEPSCRRYDESVEAYLDGALDAEATAAFEAHLEGCPGCAAELAAAGEIRASLGELPDLEAPAAVVAAVLATARAEAAARALPARRWRWPAVLATRPALAALGAALLVAIALVATLGRDRGPGQTPPMPDQATVARATLETKLALAHFARANRRVGRGLSEDLLRDRLVRPAVDGLRGVAPAATPDEDPPAGERS